MNYNIYQNAEIVSIPELSQHYKVKLNEKYYKLYSKKLDGSLKNFYILESFEIRILLDNNGNIIDKGFVRINNIKEQELAYDINIQNYSCYYTDDNTSQFYHIEGNDNIYTKLRKGELKTICFKIE